MAIDKQAVLEQLDQDTQRFRGLVNGDENDTVELEQRTEKSVAGQVKERVDEVIVGDYIRVANWEDLSGSFSPPLIVRYNSFYYQLNGSVSEIENETPVNNPNYTRVNSDLKERLRREATLDLDFQRGKYRKDDGELVETTDASELLTVQRATPKWVWGPNGKLREVAPDTVAREWDPETGKPLGVLIEGSATNLIHYSEDFSTSFWTKEGITVTDSGHGYFAVTEQAVGGLHRIRTNALFPFGEDDPDNHVLSIEVKAGTRRRVTLNQRLAGSNAAHSHGLLVDILDKVAVSIAVSGESEIPTEKSWWIEPLPDGWVRISFLRGGASSSTNGFALLLAPDDATSHSSGSQHTYTGDDSAPAVYIRRAQVEQGTTPTSYIPTDGAPVTRAADTVRRNFADEKSSRQISIIARFAQYRSVGTSSGAMFLALEGSNQPIGFNALYRFRDTGNGRDTTFNPSPDGYAVVGYTVKTNGSVVVATNDGTKMSYSNTNLDLGEVARLDIQNNNRTLHAHIDYVYCIPRALSEAELIELTTISEEE